MGLGNITGNNGGRLYSYASQPSLIDCSIVVNKADATGTGSVKGQGIQKVFMYSTNTGAAAAIGNPLTSSTYSQGYALIQLSANYQRYLGGFAGAVSPTTGGTVKIDASDAALTVGKPYIITSVGHGPSGQITIAPVADVSGSLASTYFTLFDSYGNTFVIWFSVSGVGSAPSLGTAVADGTRGLHYVQQSILSGATASQIGAALVLTIQNLPSGVQGTYSFTASGTTTVTCISTAYAPVAGIPMDGVTGKATGFTFAQTVSDTNLQDWQGVGLPKGLTPTVGQSFVATATGSGGSTGLVMAVGTSGILSVEVVGNPNTSFAPMPQGGSPNVGAWLLVQFLAPTVTGGTGAYEAPMIPTQPADGSAIGMTFYVDARLSPSNISAGAL